VWNNPLNATDPSGYIASAIVGWTIGKIAATLATEYALVNFIFTAYQVYNAGKAIQGIAHAYDSWNAGGGGAIWGNLIGGIAKGAVISWGLDSLAVYVSDVRGGTTKTDQKSGNSETDNKKIDASTTKGDGITRQREAKFRADVVCEKISCDDSINIHLGGSVKEDWDESWAQISSNKDLYFTEKTARFYEDLNEALQANGKRVLVTYGKVNAVVPISGANVDLVWYFAPNQKATSMVSFSGVEMPFSLPISDIVLHEGVHVHELATGTFSFSHSRTPAFGTTKIWEQSAIKKVNLYRRQYQRLSHKGIK
jgi:hypothetical protein